MAVPSATAPVTASGPVLARVKPPALVKPPRAATALPGLASAAAPPDEPVSTPAVNVPPV